jgi:hypothetical protein
MREPLEIRLLGSFEVVAGGTRAEVGGSKRQALLALLALRQGRVVDVDALVEGLWGEELPAAPRNALHHHIARLRAALPTPISPATKGASPGLLPRWREAVELVHRVLLELVGIGQLPEADGLDDSGPKQFLGVPRGPDG